MQIIPLYIMHIIIMIYHKLYSKVGFQLKSIMYIYYQLWVSTTETEKNVLTSNKKNCVYLLEKSYLTNEAFKLPVTNENTVFVVGVKSIWRLTSKSCTRRRCLSLIRRDRIIIRSSYSRWPLDVDYTID